MKNKKNATPDKNGKNNRRTVTIRDVAAACDLSLSTVSCALAGRDNVKPDTKRLVQDTARKLGYTPSPMARGLRTGRSWTLGVVVSDIANPFYADLLRGAQETAESLGYHLILCSTDYDAAKQRKYIDYLAQRRVDGVLLAPISSDTPDVKRLQAQRIPCVLILRSHLSVRADYVGVDNRAGMQTILEHLWQLGHRRIGLILGRPNANPNMERLAVFQEFHAVRDLQPPAAYVEHGNNTVDAGVYAARKMLQHAIAPTAIATANDLTALGVMKACTQMGLVIPQDLSLVGWDDIFVASLPHIDLTTLRVPRREIGMSAIRLLHERLTTPSPRTSVERILFRGELVVRQSAAPVHASLTHPSSKRRGSTSRRNTSR